MTDQPGRPPHGARDRGHGFLGQPYTVLTGVQGDYPGQQYTSWTPEEPVSPSEETFRGCGVCTGCNAYREQDPPSTSTGHGEVFQITECRLGWSGRPGVTRYGHEEEFHIDWNRQPNREPGSIRANGTYTSTTLLEAIAGQLAQTTQEPSAVQGSALTRWMIWKQSLGSKLDKLWVDYGEHPGHISVKIDDVNNRINLNEVFRIFDQYFFSGILCDLVDVTWLKATPETANMNGGTSRQYNDDGYLEKVEIRIILPERWTEQHIQMRLGTLMHEMCHGMFALFVCGMISLIFFALLVQQSGQASQRILLTLRYVTECQYCRCDKITVSGNGLTGHGPHWRSLVTHLEYEAERHLTGFDEPWYIKGWRVDDVSWREERDQISIRVPEYECHDCKGRRKDRMERRAQGECFCCTDQAPHGDSWS